MNFDQGPDIREYILTVLDGQIEQLNSMLTFTKDELAEYNTLFNEFKRINGSKASTKEKGQSLENIVQFIIDKSVVFEVYSNVRTSSNEIDMLARLNPRGKYFKKNGFLDFPDIFLSECKNYRSKVSVTWVGKFYSLMNYTDNDLGILFSYHGLTGSNWTNATGLTKKLYLSDKKTKIIDFQLSDFEELTRGTSFIEIITDKIFNLKNDTTIEHFISTHPSELELEKKKT